MFPVLRPVIGPGITRDKCLAIILMALGFMVVIAAIVILWMPYYQGKEKLLIPP